MLLKSKWNLLIFWGGKRYGICKFIYVGHLIQWPFVWYYGAEILTSLSQPGNIYILSFYYAISIYVYYLLYTINYSYESWYVKRDV